MTKLPHQRRKTLIRRERGRKSKGARPLVRHVQRRPGNNTLGRDPGTMGLACLAPGPVQETEWPAGDHGAAFKHLLKAKTGTLYIAQNQEYVVIMVKKWVNVLTIPGICYSGTDHGEPDSKVRGLEWRELPVDAVARQFAGETSTGPSVPCACAPYPALP